MFKLESVPRGDHKTKDLFTVLSYSYFSIVSPIRSLREVCAFVSLSDPLGSVKLLCYWTFVRSISTLYTSSMMTISLFIHTCHDRLGSSRAKCGLGTIAGAVSTANMTTMLC